MYGTRRAALVCVSLLEIFLFGGMQFGWHALVFILKQEGLFNTFCVPESEGNSTELTSKSEDCFLQDEQFNLVFSCGVAIFTLGTIVNGKLFLSFGIKWTRLLYITLAVAGILFLAFSSPDNPWLVLPGIVFVGVTGVALLVSNFIQIPFLLPRGSSIYIGLLNGCYDSSVLTFMFVKKLYEVGVDKKFSFIGVAILIIIISGVCTLLHPTRDLKGGTDAKSSQTNDGNVEMDKVSEDAVQTVPERTSDMKAIRDILRHKLFISHVVWITFVLLKYVYFLGSVNKLLEQLLHDESRVSYFSDVMTFTLIGSLVSSFIAGYTIHAMEKLFTGNMRMVIPLAVTSSLAILLSALAFVPTADILYVDFIILTFLRSFIYTTNMEFIRITFPLKYSGMIFGFVIAISGILTITQFGLFAWTEKYGDAMMHVNLFLLCLSTVSLLHPIIVFHSYRRQNQSYNL
ncbi:equilibrative nucleobase transporter 1-like [Ylistrum balloti]|uniref:equilibrative nucleobase transporter 1-like n=1 Tax=Ylistrum balloti TaxID=509963 RepID=UPI002905C421|nr:equilibrative nucleobase transporter 1-like [Ylistrum balloti]